MTVRELAAALAALPPELQDLPVFFNDDLYDVQVEAIYGLGQFPAHDPIDSIWLNKEPFSDQEKATVLYPKAAVPNPSGG